MVLNVNRPEYLEKISQNFKIHPVVALLGPRQCGKTTLARAYHAAQEADQHVTYFDLENPQHLAQLENPQLTLSPLSGLVVIDEVQRLPDLFTLLRVLVDRPDSNTRFLILGSASRDLIRQSSESLAGRCAIFDLHPFSWIESQDVTDSAKSWVPIYLESQGRIWENEALSVLSCTSIFEVLWRGFLPHAETLPADIISTFFNSYVETYVERDVKLMESVLDLHQFGRFYQLLASLTAQEINYSQIGREIDVTPQTAKRWLAVLEAGYQWHTIPAYSGNSIKRLSGKPKGYFFDSGAACAAQRISSPQALAGHPAYGPMFETMMVNEVRKQLTALPYQCSMYHWRANSGSEVDLLIEKDGVFYPIEFKGKATLNKKDANGIEAFRKHYPKLNVAPGLIVYAGVDRFFVTENVYALPWNSVLALR